MRVLRRSMENAESGNRSDSHKGRATQQQRKRTAQTKKKGILMFMRELGIRI